MGRHGKPPLSRRELRGAYREACKDRKRLQDQLHEVVQDNIRMSNRLSEIDLSMYRLDLQIQSAYREPVPAPVDQRIEETPVPVDLVKRRPFIQGQSAADAMASMRAFMIRIHESAGDVTATQELRIL